MRVKRLQSTLRARRLWPRRRILGSMAALAALTVVGTMQIVTARCDERHDEDVARVEVPGAPRDSLRLDGGTAPSADKPSAPAAPAAPPTAPSPEDAAVRRELEAAYARLAAAYEKKDADAFMLDRTPDFTAKSHFGPVAGFQQVRSGVQRRMERIQRVNFLRLHIRELSVRGTEAVAVTSQEFSRLVTDREGKEHTVVSTGTVQRETWVKTGAGWKMKSLEELEPGTQTVDGKPFERPGPPPVR